MGEALTDLTGEMERGSFERDSEGEGQEATMRHFSAVCLHSTLHIMGLLFN